MTGAVARLKKLSLASLLLMGVLGSTFVVPVPGASAVESPLDKFCAEVGDTEVCDLNEEEKRETDSQLLGSDGIVRRVINLISWLTGLLAALFLIIGGVKFATSGGDSDKVANAKRTVLYSLAGILVIAVSNVIISFVLGLVKGAESGV